MPKYKLYATQYIYMDAYVEAKDEDEANALAEAGEVEWNEAGGDWQEHHDLTSMVDPVLVRSVIPQGDW